MLPDLDKKSIFWFDVLLLIAVCVMAGLPGDQDLGGRLQVIDALTGLLLMGAGALFGVSKQ